MRKTVSVFSMVLFLFISYYPSFSHGETGKEVFQAKCGACHGKGGDAPDFSPVKYARAQWKGFFEKNRHARRTDISDKVSPSEMEVVKIYLMDHGADSDLPVAAGLFSD